ncbi:MAG TPA: hypothetical protein VFL57_11395, partial [Bryobacteraceae bacterium]|nr:hypothetical protein [Bryobacteraceae bacterium]
RRGPYGGRMPGPVMTGPRTRPAGAGEIARASGGDSMRIDDASVFQETLSRLRQRYALHYHADDTSAHDVDVQLAAAAQRRYRGAEVRFRRVSQHGGSAGEVQVSRRAPVEQRERSEPRDIDAPPRLSRRPAVNEPEGARGPAATDAGGWRRKGQVQSAPAPADAEQEQPRKGGWRKLKPGEQP